MPRTTALAPLIVLAVWAANGGHYYDIPRIRLQTAQPPQPLLHNMQPAFLQEVRPIPDKEPAVTMRLRNLLEAARTGSLQARDYTPDLWDRITPRQQQVQADLQRLGRLGVDGPGGSLG